MEERDITSLLRQAKAAIRLSHEEKERIEGVLRAHMLAHPVREGVDACLHGDMHPSTERFLGAARTIKLTNAQKEAGLLLLRARMTASAAFSPAEGGFFASLSRLSLHFRPMPALLLVLALFAGLGGVTSYAAEAALPGDALYAVKRFKESMQLRLAASAEAKARIEADQADTRLQEAEKLSTLGRLNEQARAAITQVFQEQIKKAQDRITSLATQADASVAADVSEQLDASLHAHQRVLERLAAMQVASSGSISSLLKTVREARRRMTDVSASVAKALPTEVSDTLEDTVRETIDSAKKRAEEMRSSFEKRHAQWSDDMAQEADEQVKRVQDAIDHAVTELQEGAASRALDFAREARRAVREGTALSDIQDKLRIGVHTKGSGKSHTTVHTVRNGKERDYAFDGSGSLSITEDDESSSSASPLTTSSSDDEERRRRHEVRVESHVETHGGGESNVESHVNLELWNGVERDGDD